jgi:DNA-binding CsgD family transcriptional regulator
MEDWGEFSELIGELYDAASGNASFWPFAPKIAAAFASGSCTLWVRDGFAGPVEELSVTANHTPEQRARYEAYYYQHDVWVNNGLAFPKGTLMSGDEVISDDEFRESAIYQDHARHAGCFHVLGALVPIGGPAEAFGMFGLHRSETESRFGSDDRRRGTIFLPHLKRALQLREKLARLEIQQRAMAQATETLAVGVMLVSSGAQIIFTNPMAESILRRGKGLHARNHQLFATSPATDSELRRHIQNAARSSTGHAGDDGGLLRVARNGAKPLTLSIYPFAAPHLSDGRTVPAALVFVSDPDLIEQPRRDVLAQMYRLTAAEAKLFEALLAGTRLQDYAEQSSLSREAVKTQLARLCDKTGHARQTELVRDALRNPLLNLKNR